MCPVRSVTHFSILKATSINPQAAERYGSPLVSTAQITRAFLLATASVARLYPRRWRSWLRPRPAAANQACALDFVHGSLMSGRRFRMAVAQFSLLERSALIVGVPRQHRCASLALAHAAARGVSAGEQLNLSGHELMFPSGAGRPWRFWSSSGAPTLTQAASVDVQ